VGPPVALASIERVNETETPVREVEMARSAVPLEAVSPGRVTVIRPAPCWPHLDFSELWHYRELLFSSRSSR
jgi:hypothetical protein